MAHTQQAALSCWHNIISCYHLYDVVDGWSTKENHRIGLWPMKRMDSLSKQLIVIGVAWQYYNNNKLLVSLMLIIANS